jgi:anti-sigma regulatory factor (Ser/Thr protein kinase)
LFEPIHALGAADRRSVGLLADDAAIVVAEFAANAVLHARSGFTVTLRCSS